jgi:RNA polymerase sigma-70 factor (ECF subfamily)
MDKKESTRNFVDMIEEHQDIIHKISFFYSDHEEDRKDLEQEIIYQLWKSYPSFKNRSQFTTWMYRVALNTAILDLRNRKNRPENIRITGQLLNLPDQTETDDESVLVLFKAIEQLAKVDRALILLYLENKSYEEIASIIGLTSKNVSVKLVRIKEKLRKSFSLSVKNKN